MATEKTTATPDVEGVNKSEDLQKKAVQQHESIAPETEQQVKEEAVAPAVDDVDETAAQDDEQDEL